MLLKSLFLKHNKPQGGDMSLLQIVLLKIYFTSHLKIVKLEGKFIIRYSKSFGSLFVILLYEN
ncbi:hypothetical protein DXU93_05240 [Brumimicrobium aurantiacum]|uniref:Uncharacterized protein n=1 Tax=Brumimicrobium aurantiacum TaxID=1737063 RepID=A0A3E1F0I5_9FLAO|nr:hypothetical protein DXU93_05240 [Brumimicrobium aurantiacum]